MMNISIIGAGYVGLITGVGFAKLGNKVSIVDLNHDLIQKLNNNQMPFYEPDLEDYIKNPEVAENIFFYSDYESSIDKNTDMVFVCVQTPTDFESGKTDTTYLKNVLVKLNNFNNYEFTICIKSTVNSKLIKNICKEINLEYEKIIFNPEFLREGSALFDFFNPDRIVIGGSDINSLDKCLKLYDSFECEKIITDSISSQIIKYLSNTYLAMRLSFVNETFKLVSEFGGNPNQILNAIGKDNRIGNHYFRPSPGWGGSCFPKDVKEVSNFLQNDYQSPLISKIIESNELHMDWFADYLLRSLKDKNLSNIILIGAPFKENTDDMRESPTLKIYDRLANKFQNTFILDLKVKLASDYKLIESIEDLEEDTLYVEMFPDSSNERLELLKEVKKQKNSFVLKMWETS
jgi:UDPglucose 6-dehydrogenase|tara:strand:- start:1291 stop:2502 length:1212 start_codon:yes stop_codon:yes gene_type:complete